MCVTKEQVGERIIVALDCSDITAAERLVKTLQPYVGCFKIGFEFMQSVLRQALTNADLAFIKHAGELFRALDGKVFWDAKFHDIPNTVSKAVEQATSIGVKMVNVHASGGLGMMKAAKRAASDAAERAGVSPPLVLGVTILTSLTYADLSGMRACPQAVVSHHEEDIVFDQVRLLACLAQEAGLDGVVCSPEEILLVREACGPDFVIVTPGIRPEPAPHDDQKRTMTPAEAIMDGANYLVIGRPITKADDPELALAGIIVDALSEIIDSHISDGC